MSSCEIILTSYLSNLGSTGERISVASGYASYLLSHSYAVFATEENIKKYESRKDELKILNAQKVASYKELAATIDGQKINLKYNTMPDGRLFGSVGIKDVLIELKNIGCTEIRASDIIMDHNIRSVGNYEVIIRFDRNISATIKIFIESL
ncbi:MAG: 50S ribosomal protein L9 [Anaplasmataceae bacterium]|nr:50S ribosomal protein L9 [Anaplasmataceae bacterium]